MNNESNPVYELAQEQWDDEAGAADLVEHFDTAATKTDAERMVSALVGNIAHDRIVDLGCGPGRYATRLPDFKTYKGYDTSTHLLAVARANNKGVKGVRFFERDIFDGADYKKPVDLLLSIDTSRHYRDPLQLLETIMELWPSHAYLFSILHGSEDAELINGRCLATSRVDTRLPLLGRISAQVEQAIPGDMVVRYVVMHSPA